MNLNVLSEQKQIHLSILEGSIFLMSFEVLWFNNKLPHGTVNRNKDNITFLIPTTWTKLKF